MTIPVSGRRVHLDLRDQFLARELYAGYPYEPEIQGLFRELDLAGSICLDIGANVGIHTLALSELVGPVGRVHAFEPEPNNLALLDRNLRTNGVANVTVHPCALGDTPGTARLAVSASNYGDHRVRASSGIEVELDTGDNRLIGVPAGAIRLVKIDVQGYECHVLRGLRHTLAANPEAVLLLEVDPQLLAAAGESARNLVGLVRELGYSGWELAPYRLLPLLDPWVYELFREGRFTNILLARKPSILRQALTRLFGADYMSPIP